MRASDIEKLLDISPPFLMIDGINKITHGLSAETYYAVDRDAWFFDAHLKSSPAMPGVLITECMLQTSMLIIYNTDITSLGRGYVHKFEVKLQEKVEQKLSPIVLVTKSKLLSSRRGISEFESSCINSKSNEIVATAKITHFVPTISLSR